MKKTSPKHQNQVLRKLGVISNIPKENQDLVLARLRKVKENPDRLLSWNEDSKALTGKSFDAKKFAGVLKVNEDALVIQKRLRDEWN
jgi:hypothetical protein